MKFFVQERKREYDTLDIVKFRIIPQIVDNLFEYRCDTLSEIEVSDNDDDNEEIDLSSFKACDFQLLYETIVDYFEVVENPRYACIQILIASSFACRQIFLNVKTTNRTAADVRSETLKLLNGN